MINEYTEIKECLACGCGSLLELLNLNDQPLANSYTKNKEILPEYPLKINRCSNCCHVQLSVAVNPDLMFKDYLYVSGTSKTMLNYFEWFVNYSKEYYNTLFKVNPKSVLDIGCNDGSLLDKYKYFGLSTQGIDPAENLHIESSKKHNIICGYFDKTNISKIDKHNIIVAQNVFAHNYSPLEFLDNIKEIMSNDTLLFVQTSQANMILNNEYDTIYHEHVSFFNIKSMKELCLRAGLYLIDVEKTHIHGVSYLFIISKENLKPANIFNLIEVEKLNGLYSNNTYDRYKEICENSVSLIKSEIDKYKDLGYIIIGYGAAAKGNTLLNYTKISMDYIIDDNPLKWDYHSPGSQIKIVSKDILLNYSETDKLLYVPLAWNFFTEISSNIKTVRNNSNDKFLRYFPTVEIL